MERLEKGYRLPSKPLSKGKSPVGIAAELLKDCVGIEYNEDDDEGNWIILSPQDIKFDRDENCVIIVYACVIPESSEPNEHIDWLTVDKIMPIESSISQIDKTILRTFGMGGGINA
jgi:hypothetical protein